MREKLIKIGARVVRHGRYITFLRRAPTLWLPDVAPRRHTRIGGAPGRNWHGFFCTEGRWPSDAPNPMSLTIPYRPGRDPEEFGGFRKLIRFPNWYGRVNHASVWVTVNQTDQNLYDCALPNLKNHPSGMRQMQFLGSMLASDVHINF